MTDKQDWQGKKVAVIGLGIEGEDLARYFAEHHALVTVSDAKTRDQLALRIARLEPLGVRFALGRNDPADVADADLVCVSQGVPLTNPAVAAARARGVPLESMTTLFLDRYPGPVCGITGSSGKTTTTSLVDAVFTAANRDHVLGGNIGRGLMALLDRTEGSVGEARAGGRSSLEQSKAHAPGFNLGSSSEPRQAHAPPVDHASPVRPQPAEGPRTSRRASPSPETPAPGFNPGSSPHQRPASPDDAATWAVIEISHTQLALTRRSPQVAALLNVTPNHLDQFSWDEYIALKRKIFAYQDRDGAAVFNADDPVSRELRPQAKGRVFLFSVAGDPNRDGAFLHDGSIYWRRDGRTERALGVVEIPMRGFHNVANVCAATAIAAACDLGPIAVAAAVRDFKPPPHRIELVARVRGVDYYNDSIATAPERTLAALRSFEEPVVLLLGGRDKNLPLDDLMTEVGRRCRAVVCFGESGPLLAAAAQATGVTLDRVDSLSQAVELAAVRARPGDVVLLSPACTSFDAYDNFEQRGTEFRQLTAQLEAEAPR